MVKYVLHIYPCLFQLFVTDLKTNHRKLKICVFFFFKSRMFSEHILMQCITIQVTTDILKFFDSCVFKCRKRGREL
jgi:hypothetical protein